MSRQTRSVERGTTGIGVPCWYVYEQDSPTSGRWWVGTCSSAEDAELLVRGPLYRETLEKIISEYAGVPGDFDQSHHVISSDVQRIAREALHG